tara:strand:+ start:326 stop:1372 length:1047 start_codon:yes stop_codon:yes gene_type:complete
MANNLSNYFQKEIKDQAVKFGFSSARITSPTAIPRAEHDLGKFLQKGFHGQMDWLEKRSKWRVNPKELWPEVQSIIMLTEIYTPEGDALCGLKKKDCGNISVYAHGHDYHDVMKKRLKRYGSWLVNFTEANIKVFVDTAPVMEKPLAQMAGLGWQGKHTNLVSREIGNWFFIGCIFTDLKIDVDQQEVDHCGDCTRCLDICPTSAFVEPYKLDARKCISYLTIEHKGPIDLELRSKIGNRIYGCDDCLAVCPWNKFAKSATELKYHSKKDLNIQPLQNLAILTDKQFRQKFAGSPIKRIGRNRFVRNVLYAMGNSAQSKFNEIINSLLLDADLGVRDAALWAKEKLNG